MTFYIEMIVCILSLITTVIANIFLNDYNSYLNVQFAGFYIYKYLLKTY